MLAAAGPGAPLRYSVTINLTYRPDRTQRGNRATYTVHGWRRMVAAAGLKRGDSVQLEPLPLAPGMGRHPFQLTVLPAA